MHWLWKIIVVVAANALGIWLANAYVPGFVFTGNLAQLFGLALVLALLNLLLKPILKAVLGPIIVLTLGLGIVIVNAVILYVLDLLSKNLTIEGIPALVLSSLIVSIINFVFHLVA